MRVVRYHNGDQNVTAIVAPVTRLWVQLVTFGYPISVTKVRKEELRHMTDLDYKGGVQRACRQLLKRAKVAGITKGARALLKQGKNSCTSI